MRAQAMAAVWFIPTKSETRVVAQPLLWSSLCQTLMSGLYSASAW